MSATLAFILYVASSTAAPSLTALAAYDSAGGEYRTSFTSGPYKSLDDAKLARSGISACPPEPEPADGKDDK